MLNIEHIIIFYTEVKAICEAFMDVIKIFLEMISENHEKEISWRGFFRGEGEFYVTENILRMASPE